MPKGQILFELINTLRKSKGSTMMETFPINAKGKKKWACIGEWAIIYIDTFVTLVS